MSGTFIELPAYGAPNWQGPVATVPDLPLTDPPNTIREVTSTQTLYVWDGSAWTIIGAAISPTGISDTDSVDLTVTAGVLTADVRLSSDVADAGYIRGELAIRSGASPGLRSQVADSLIRALLSGTNLITYTAATGVIDLTSATVRAQISGTNLITYTAATGVIDLTAATVRALFGASSPLVYFNGVTSIPQSSSTVDGYLSSIDWVTFNSKQPLITPGTTADFYRGDKTFQLLQMSALTATTAGTAAASGAIGEILTGTQAANTGTGIGGTGTFGAVTSVNLTAGSWKIHGTAGFNENGAVLTTALQCGISTSATGVGISEFNTTINPFLISSTSDALFSTPDVYVDIAAPGTYYLNTRFYYTSGTPQHRGKITAIRIR